ncbi:hypothetical protein AB0D46_26990 [Streptomyces sp. NPDC048383]
MGPGRRPPARLPRRLIDPDGSAVPGHEPMAAPITPDAPAVIPRPSRTS